MVYNFVQTNQICFKNSLSQVHYGDIVDPDTVLPVIFNGQIVHLDWI